jgi:putative transposase
VSRETISKITDQIVDEMLAWQSRPLDPLYAVLLIDCLVIKVRGSQVANRPVYVAIGVNLDGERDVLGLWLGPTGGDGAKQWATMLTELRNRGLRDALIVCCDGLQGLPESIRLTWPDATVQTCVVHMVRNSLRYSSRNTGPGSPRRCERSTTPASAGQFGIAAISPPSSPRSRCSTSSRPSAARTVPT